jgi:hypothetical protein
MYEGFGNNSNSDSSSNSKPYFNSNSNNSSSNNDSSNSTTQPNTDQIKQVITQKIKDASQNNTTDSSDSSNSSKKIKNSKAAEGFDILGIENNIKRGKQSNSIPVNSFMRDADSVAPYEGTSFLGSFSPF